MPHSILQSLHLIAFAHPLHPNSCTLHHILQNPLQYLQFSVFSAIAHQLRASGCSPSTHVYPIVFEIFLAALYSFLCSLVFFSFLPLIFFSLHCRKFFPLFYRFIFIAYYYHYMHFLFLYIFKYIFRKYFWDKDISNSCRKIYYIL